MIWVCRACGQRWDPERERFETRGHFRVEWDVPLVGGQPVPGIEQDRRVVHVECDVEEYSRCEAVQVAP